MFTSKEKYDKNNWIKHLLKSKVQSNKEVVNDFFRVSILEDNYSLGTSISHLDIFDCLDWVYGNFKYKMTNNSHSSNLKSSYSPVFKKSLLLDLEGNFYNILKVELKGKLYYIRNENYNVLCYNEMVVLYKSPTGIQTVVYKIELD